MFIKKLELVLRPCTNIGADRLNRDVKIILKMGHFRPLLFTFGICQTNKNIFPAYKIENCPSSYTVLRNDKNKEKRCREWPILNKHIQRSGRLWHSWLSVCFQHQRAWFRIQLLVNAVQWVKHLLLSPEVHGSELTVNTWNATCLSARKLYSEKAKKE